MTGTERDNLILSAWPLLPKWVRQKPFRRYAHWVDDPISVMAVGLCIAADTYDPQRCAFFTWAKLKMKAQMREAWRKIACQRRGGCGERNQVIPVHHVNVMTQWELQSPFKDQHLFEVRYDLDVILTPFLVPDGMRPAQDAVKRRQAVRNYLEGMPIGQAARSAGLGQNYLHALIRDVLKPFAQSLR